ncbi:hypothetical protein Mapa_003898 [Marchantia paleacea]|nr:hypothetical protein Mapa_003898 [Marchantia paleacea]
MTAINGRSTAFINFTTFLARGLGSGSVKRRRKAASIAAADPITIHSSAIFPTLRQGSNRSTLSRFS